MYHTNDKVKPRTPVQTYPCSNQTETLHSQGTLIFQPKSCMYFCEFIGHQITLASTTKHTKQFLNIYKIS